MGKASDYLYGEFFFATILVIVQCGVEDGTD